MVYRYFFLELPCNGEGNGQYLALIHKETVANDA